MDEEPVVESSEGPVEEVELPVNGKMFSLNGVRRRCWDEAFSSTSESESVSPEPGQCPGGNMDGDNMCNSSTKSTDNSVKTSIVCEAHPSCFKTFSSGREYESHYNLRHRHKCITCKKSLPSAHILELHVLEAHDTLFSLMAERKPMLACFLESCSSTFWKPEERKEHCLSEHHFPQSFLLWDLTATGGSKLGNKKSGYKGNGTNKTKQMQDKSQRSSKNKTNNKMQTETNCPSADASSTSDVSKDASAPPVPTKDETMELDTPAQVMNTTSSSTNHQTSSKAPKQSCSTKTKNGGKSIPIQITFGQSTARTFKPKYSFGVAKPVVPGEGISSSSTTKLDLDMSDIKDVLPTSTPTSVCPDN